MCHGKAEPSSVFQIRRGCIVIDCLFSIYISVLFLEPKSVRGEGAKNPSSPPPPFSDGSVKWRRGLAFYYHFFCLLPLVIVCVGLKAVSVWSTTTYSFSNINKRLGLLYELQLICFQNTFSVILRMTICAQLQSASSAYRFHCCCCLSVFEI